MNRTVPLHYCLACGAYWRGAHSCQPRNTEGGSDWAVRKAGHEREQALAAATEALVKAALVWYAEYPDATADTDHSLALAVEAYRKAKGDA